MKPPTVADVARCGLDLVVIPAALGVATIIGAGVVVAGLARRWRAVDAGWCPLCDARLFRHGGGSTCPACAWAGGAR